MERPLILPLKQCYFDPILKLEKIYEYRADTKFYRERLTHQYKKIIFHAYSSERIICDIIGIKRIKNPLKNQNLPFLSTDYVFEIELKNPQLRTNILE